jgi:ABC-2 type transport system permease protein
MPDADNPLPADNPISSRLHQLLFLFPGGIKSTDQSGIHFVPLVKTSRQSGTVSDDILSQRRNPEMMDISRKILGEPVVIGAWVGSDPDKISMNGSSSRPADAKDSNSTTEDARGKKTSDPPAAPNNETKPESDKSKTNINVVFVADIDCLASDFLQVRAQPSREVQWQFDNVTFVLNILDVLAGDRSFVEIRKRQTRHSTLKLVEDQTSAASERAEEEIDQYNKDFDRAKGDAENAQKESLQKFQSVVDNLRKKQDEGVEEANQHETMRQLQTALQSLAIQTETLQRSTQIKIERLQRERDKGLKRINRELDQDIQAVQRRYKLLAVLIPPVPPLILGLTVFMNRRMRERESITEARRR